MRRTIARYAMIAPGDRVLIAVSGGPDSVALLGVLHMLAHRLRFELCMRHTSITTCGAESDRDQACAAAVAARFGVPCTIGSSVGCGRGANLEAQARAQRYAFLTDVAAAQGCAKIATGHTPVRDGRIPVRDARAAPASPRLASGTQTVGGVSASDGNGREVFAKGSRIRNNSG